MIHRTSFLFTFGLVLCSCGPDAADRAYLAALRGDADGSTYEQRIAHLDRAIALEPGLGRYHESRAILRIDQRAFDAALTDLDHAIEIGDRPWLRFLRGLVLCQRGDCTAAITEFDRAIAEQPGNTQFYRGRALARVAVGSPDAALADAELLVQNAPQVGSSYYARGLALAALARHHEAVREFDEALARHGGRKTQANPHCAWCTDPFRYCATGLSRARSG